MPIFKNLKITVLQPAPNVIVGRLMYISLTLPGGFPDYAGASGAFVNSSGNTVGTFGVGRINGAVAGTIEIPAGIRAGEPFSLRLDAQATTGDPDAGTSVTYIAAGGISLTLEYVVPSITMDAFQSPQGVLQLPSTFWLSGTASEASAPYGIAAVQCRVGNGPLVNATLAVAGNGFTWWSAQVSVPTVGDTIIVASATDKYGAVATTQRTVRVYRYPVPTSSDPNTKKTRLGLPTTSSVTSWTRLEPQCSNADIGASSNARLFDPLWLMTRQWQMGEFQAEDTGSPVQARVRATTAPLSRCLLGPLSARDTLAPSYDPLRAPLETLVERRSMRARDDKDARMLQLSVEAGLHCLRMLEVKAVTKKYRPAFLATYPLQRPENLDELDEATSRFFQTMAGRAPDGRRLAVALRAPSTVQIVLDPVLKVVAADVAAVQEVAAAWLRWYDTLFAEPAANEDAWIASRLEYTMSVATRLGTQPQDAVTFSASEFDGGRLDWSSFDVNNTFTIDTTADRNFTSLSQSTVPTQVSFPGAPAPRFWEVEDAKVAYGLLPVGPTDLAHLLMVEYAGSYGNDWYVVPLTLPVGSVTRVDSLVVTDTFGVRSLLRPIGDPALPAAYFSMWQPAGLRYAGKAFTAPVPNTFFLPPTLARSIDAAPLEDVLFMRDEMANVAWAIERSVESPIEQVLSRAHQPDEPQDAPALPQNSGDTPRYQLASHVPEHWVPLLPVQTIEAGKPDKLLSRLRRGAVLQADGSNKSFPAQGQVLEAGSDLLLYDEEIPREGVRVTRTRRMTRWIDGSGWVWTAFRKQVGRGEGSSALQFDQVIEPGE